jgi:hypothetical protein
MEAFVNGAEVPPPIAASRALVGIGLYPMMLPEACVPDAFELEEVTSTGGGENN